MVKEKKNIFLKLFCDVGTCEHISIQKLCFKHKILIFFDIHVVIETELVYEIRKLKELK
jgi:hypothetical protein